MISERRKAAARANGAKSRGPKTVEGKRRSSQNSRTHNLFSRDLIVDGESPDDFAPILDEIQAQFQPESPLAISAMHAMADAHWRQRRLWRTETETLDAEYRRQRALDPAADPVALRTRAFRWLADHTRLLDLYARCDARFERAILRARALLAAEQIRKAKTAQPAQPEVRQPQAEAATPENAEQRQPPAAPERLRHRHQPARPAVDHAPARHYFARLLNNRAAFSRATPGILRYPQTGRAAARGSPAFVPRLCAEKNENCETNPKLIENKGHEVKQKPGKTQGNPGEPKPLPGRHSTPIILKRNCLPAEPRRLEPRRTQAIPITNSAEIFS